MAAGWPQALAVPQDGWLGLPMKLSPMPAHDDIADVAAPNPLLAVARSGSGQRSFTSGTYRRDMHTAPRMVEIYGAGTYFDVCRVRGTPGEIISIEFPNATLARLLPDMAHPFDLGTQHELFDDRLFTLTTLLWEEAASGSQRGRLYREGLTIALVGLLDSLRATAGEPDRMRVGKFSVAERARLMALIKAELAGDLAVERLAQVVGMSPFRFARAFKTTFDQSPHAFVIDKRIDAACTALRLEPGRAIADVAHGCGFSSQAHFAEAFRRKVGTTPSRWRSAQA